MNKTVTVLIADSRPDFQDEVIVKEGISFDEIVYVYQNFDRSRPDSLIGKARLFWEGDELKAELSVDGGEELFQFDTPAIGGYIIEREGSEIKRCIIREVSLVSHNADDRIRPIGEQ